MTISSPTFQRLQDGIQRVDDLRARGPINAALAWLSGDLVTQLNTHFGEVSQSISVAIQALKGTANTWSAAQTIQISTAGSALTLNSTDAGASGGPRLTMLRESASPAVNDEIGGFLMNGRNSAAGTVSYARFRAVILDPTDGSEDGELQLLATVGGAEAAVMRYSNGVQIGSPTGGYQGAGTLNLDNALYKDGTQVISSRITGWGDPFGASSRATFSTTTATANQVAEALAALITDLKTHGVIGT